MSTSPAPPVGRPAADGESTGRPPAGGPPPDRPASARSGIDAGLSALLVLLVAGSLVLTGRLWLTNPYLAPPPQQPAEYIAAGASGRAVPADLLMPLRIVLRSTAGDVRGLGNPGDPVFKAIWAAARQVLADVGPSAAAAGQPSDVAALAAAGGSAPSVELWFGGRMPWFDMWAALTGSAGSGGPQVDRVLIVPGATGSQVFLGAGTAIRRLTLPAAAARPLAQEIDALPNAGDPLMPLDPVNGVRVLPGIFVPVGVPPPVAAKLEPLNLPALVDASFRDPSVVRMAVEANGSRFYTDGADWLRVSRAGAVRWAAPEVSVPLRGGWTAVLGRAVRFVDHRGGWPASATLIGVQGVTASGGLPGRGGGSSPNGYRLAFAVRYQGWEVFGSPPAVSVSVGESGVTSYLRRVPVASAVQPGSSGITAELALQSLAADWPAAVVPSERLVADVFTCYVYRGGRQLTPAWDVAMADGSQVAVDALDGRVIGLLPEPA